MWGEKKQPARFAQKIIMLKMDAFGVPFTGLQVFKAFGVAFTCLWGVVLESNSQSFPQQSVWVETDLNVKAGVCVSSSGLLWFCCAMDGSLNGNRSRAAVTAPGRAVLPRLQTP